MSNDKKSILKEAALQYEDIMKKAKELTKNKDISTFNKLIKESLENDINKRPVQESFLNDENKESNQFDDETGGQEEPNTSDDSPNIFTEALSDQTNDAIDITEMTFEELAETFDSAEDEDEFNPNQDELGGISLEDLENDLSGIEVPEENQPEEESENNVEDAEVESDDLGDEQTSTAEVLKTIQDEIGKLITSLEDKDSQEQMSGEFDNHMQTIYGEGYREKLGENYDDLFSIYKQNKMENKNQNPEQVSENIEDLNIEDQNNEPKEDEMDEAHGSQLSLNKRAGADVQPRPEFADYKKSKLRTGVQEGFDKRIETLINENKKLKKQLSTLNENTNKLTQNITEKNTLVENFTDVLAKYRTRLSEMVVFNTNLANVNNLLINEGLALNTKDKEKIVNSFKTVSTIEESKQKYGELLTEMKNASSSNIETIGKKIDTSIASSSKQLVNEVVEATSYQQQNSEIKKMMDRINYTHKK